MTTANPADQDYLERRSPVYRGVVWTERGIAMVLLVALLALIVAQIFTRYVLNAPLSWTEELARFVFIWFTFMSAAYVMARRRHITVILFGAKGSGRVVSVFEAVAYLIVIVVATAMVVGGVQLVSGASRLVSPGTGIPLGVVYAAIVVGYGLIAVHSAFNIYLALRYPAQYRESDDIAKAGV